MRHLWFQPVLATPRLGARVLGHGDQRIARFLFAQNPDLDAFTPEDIEVFLARLRDPVRARTGSAVYRGFILPELVRIMRGAYRSTRLTTPTRVLFGADDPALRPEFITGHEPYVDDLQIEFVPGAGHFIAEERPVVVLDRATTFFSA